MKITHRITAEADAAAVRYGNLVEGWRSLYQRALDQADFGSPRMFTKVTNEALEMGIRFMAAEDAYMESALDDIAAEAHTATANEIAAPVADEFTEAVSDHLYEAESYLRGELSTVIERDIRFLKDSLRRAVLQVKLSARAQRITERTALMQYRIGNAQELHFYFHDRGNQKWPTRKFVRSVWRHSLLSTYNEVVLLTLSDHGLEHAEVVHDNPKSDVHGLKIAMSANGTLPTYAEIRAEIFHPNADAILRKAA
jgi:hypothetical protein